MESTESELYTSMDLDECIAKNNNQETLTTEGVQNLLEI